MEAFTPAQTVTILGNIGTKKARQRLDKMFVNCVAGSFLLGFGCALNVSTNCALWFQEHAPGLIKIISACVFPVGLIMCFLTGADLFTSYCMVCLMTGGCTTSSYLT
jgi:formate/nitrite transporter FocA (FNT family)